MAGRREWTRYWLVDPLDGTKEFLARTGEFTINIAMVMGLFPVVGLPLPFFSYGGSLLLTICVSLGLLISINRTIRTVSIN